MLWERGGDLGQSKIQDERNYIRNQGPALPTMKIAQYFLQGLTMEWILGERGFLPNEDPVRRLGDPVFEPAERLGADLPELVHDRKFRDASAEYLKAPIDWNAVMSQMADPEIERLFVLFSYFTSAYVHSPGLPA